jgi:hypothetical protein
MAGVLGGEIFVNHSPDPQLFKLALGIRLVENLPRQVPLDHSSNEIAQHAWTNGVEFD